MSSREPLVLFLSCVSSEFHQADSEGQQTFYSYREKLASHLRLLGMPLQILYQTDDGLTQGEGDLLKTLDDDVARSHVVVHLAGSASGSAPGERSLRLLRERHPNLLAHEPELLKHWTNRDWFIGQIQKKDLNLLASNPEILRDFATPAWISFTQWEYLLARHHRARTFTYLAAADAPRSPALRLDDTSRARQHAHLALLEKVLAEHYQWVHNADELAMLVLHALAKNGLVDMRVRTPAERQSLRETARRAAGQLRAMITASVKKPDPVALGTAPSSGDKHIHALDLAAASIGGERSDVVAALDAEAEELRQKGALLELAATELALGRYRQAMRFAEETSERALAKAAEDPDQVATHLIAALNAQLLLETAATLAGDAAKAFQALQNAAQFADREANPLLWAQCQFDLAERLSNYGHYEEALERINEVLDVREGLLPESHEDVLAALNLWAQIKLFLGDHPGAESVSGRVLRLCRPHPLFQPRLLAHALHVHGQALENEGELAHAMATFKEMEMTIAQLCKNEAGNLEYHRLRSIALGNVGRLQEKRRELEDALGMFVRSNEISLQLCMKEPGILAHQRALGITMENIGRVQEKQGALEKALGMFERSFEIRKQLCRKEPENLAYQRELGVVLDSVGRILEKKDEVAEALLMFDQGRMISEQLCQKEPGNLLYQWNLHFPLYWSGRCLRKLHRKKESREVLAKAEAILSRLAETGYKQGDLIEKVARVQEELAQLDASTNSGKPTS